MKRGVAERQQRRNVFGAFAGEQITLGVRDFLDQAVGFQQTRHLSGLAAAVFLVSRCGEQEFPEVAVAEAADQEFSVADRPQQLRIGRIERTQAAMTTLRGRTVRASVRYAPLGAWAWGWKSPAS